MSLAYILWWENESGDWNFVSAHTAHESAKDAKEEELASDPNRDREYYITSLALKESK